MDDLLEDWFVREVLSHEAALTRYLTHAWSTRADIPDMRQQIYIKVLEAAEKLRPTSPRYFLFAVAKNLVADYARKNRIVPIHLLQESEPPDVLLDELSPERRAGSFQQLQRLVEAFERLPDRCREVVWMRKIEGMAQKDIAGRLKIAEGTVEAHLVRGMRLLTQLFFGEADNGSEAGRRRWEHESQHER